MPKYAVFALTEHKEHTNGRLRVPIEADVGWPEPRTLPMGHGEGVSDARALTGARGVAPHLGANGASDEKRQRFALSGEGPLVTRDLDVTGRR